MPLWVRRGAHPNRPGAFVALLTATAMVACVPTRPAVTRVAPTAASSATSAPSSTTVASSSPPSALSAPPSYAAPSTAPAPATPASPPSPAAIAKGRGVVRYRLRIHDNPVDSAEAFRCYGVCKDAATEATYLECLGQCPGFEVAAGVTCGPDEGIPLSVCIDRRPTAPRQEPTPGLIVVAMLLDIAVLFSLSSLCNASASQCGFAYGYVPR